MLMPMVEIKRACCRQGPEFRPDCSAEFCATPPPSREYGSSLLCAAPCATWYYVSFDRECLLYRGDVRNLCTSTYMLHVGCTQEVFMVSVSTSIYMYPAREIWHCMNWKRHEAFCRSQQINRRIVCWQCNSLRISSVR